MVTRGATTARGLRATPPSRGEPCLDMNIIPHSYESILVLDMTFTFTAHSYSIHLIAAKIF